MIYHHYNVAYISGAPSLVTTTNILAAYLCIKREEWKLMVAANERYKSTTIRI